MKKNQTQFKGFAHLILLILVFIIVIVGVVYFVVMGSQNNISQSLSNLYAKPTQMATMTPSPTTVELEDQLNSVDDSDPSSDFQSVDSDINSL